MCLQDKKNLKIIYKDPNSSDSSSDNSSDDSSDQSEPEASNNYVRKKYE